MVWKGREEEIGRGERENRVCRKRHTKKRQTPQHVHPRKRGKPQFQKIHDTPQQRGHGPGFRDQVF